MKLCCKNLLSVQRRRCWWSDSHGVAAPFVFFPGRQSRKSVVTIAVEAAAHAALMNSLGSALQQGTARSLDFKLASKAACGRLRADAVVDSLVTSFLMTFKEGLHKKRYQTTGQYA